MWRNLKIIQGIKLTFCQKLDFSSILHFWCMNIRSKHFLPFLIAVRWHYNVKFYNVEFWGVRAAAKQHSKNMKFHPISGIQSNRSILLCIFTFFFFFPHQFLGNSVFTFLLLSFLFFFPITSAPGIQWLEQMLNFHFSLSKFASITIEGELKTWITNSNQ